MPYKDKEKNYACTRRWLANNKAYAREQTAIWQSEHPERMREHNAEYRHNNPDKIAKKNKRYRKLHPEVFKAKDAKRRTAVTKAGGAYTSAQWIALCNKYGNRCLCCHKKLKLTADHVIPVSKGGTSNIDNIQPLCGPCNSKKHTGTTDFRITFVLNTTKTRTVSKT
jgi:5-methylcytosine-specific restriction endonuclease McrA